MGYECGHCGGIGYKQALFGGEEIVKCKDCGAYSYTEEGFKKIKGERKMNKSRRVESKIKFSKKERELYNTMKDRGMTPAEIAAEFGFSESTLRRRLISSKLLTAPSPKLKKRVAPQKSFTKEELDEYNLMKDAGWTQEEMAAYFGISRTTLRRRAEASTSVEIPVIPYPDIYGDMNHFAYRLSAWENGKRVEFEVLAMPEEWRGKDELYTAKNDSEIYSRVSPDISEFYADFMIFLRGTHKEYDNQVVRKLLNKEEYHRIKEALEEFTASAKPACSTPVKEEEGVYHFTETKVMSKTFGEVSIKIYEHPNLDIAISIEGQDAVVVEEYEGELKVLVYSPDTDEPTHNINISEDFRQLMPCPFCGKKEHIRIATNEELSDPSDEPVFTVVCSHISGGCGSSAGYRRTKSEARDLWNRREY